MSGDEWTMSDGLVVGVYAKGRYQDDRYWIELRILDDCVHRYRFSRGVHIFENGFGLSLGLNIQPCLSEAHQN